MTTGTPPQITFQFSRDERALDWRQIERLIAELFRDQRDVTRVAVTPLPGSSAGLSSISLLLALPSTHEGAEHNPVAVRIGTREAIAHERENYLRYIDPSVGVERVQLRHASQPEGQGAALAALGYSYLGQADQPIRTLRDYLWSATAQQPAITAIRALFAETLGRGGGIRNGWHSDTQRQSDQRPCWFYNRMLPPALVLADVTVGGSPDTPVEIAGVLAAADRPDSAALTGRRVIFAPSAAYPALRMAEPEQALDGQTVRLRVHLLEGPAAGGGIYRALDPIAARLELRVPLAELPRVRSALEADAPLGGVIVGTRYGALRRQVDLNQLRRSDNIPGLDLTHSGRAICDPLGTYGALLGAPLTLHTSIIHGDLNLGNILIREHGYGSERGVSAWLIDFDQTGPGGHTVFDLVKLETEYKLHLLPHRLHSRSDFLRLEAALHAALISPASVDELLRDDQDLIQAYEFIAALRQVALSPPKGARPQPVEYYLGLLGYGLATLKYRNLYDEGRERWLLSTARVEPLAVAAYLSAAFAATVIDEVRDSGVVPESYRPPERRWGLRRKPPPLFASREEIVEAAYQHLRGTERLAVIHGPVGSGREGVADHIGYLLERAGYQVIAPKLDDRVSPHQSAAAILGDTILSDLEITHRVAGLPNRLSSLPDSDAPGYWSAQIGSYCRQLAAALTADQRRFAIILPPRSGDSELAILVNELSRVLLDVPLLIIASAPLAELPSRAQWAIPALNAADLRAYAQHAQRDLSDERIERLLRKSGGLPILVTQLLDQPREIWDTPGDTATPRVATQVAQQILDRLDVRLQWIAAIDSMLASFGFVVREPDLEAIAGRLPAYGWDSAQALQQILVAYRAEVAGGVRELLGEAAQQWLTGRPEYRKICAAAASYYASYPTAKAFYLAARYAALIGEWVQAEAQMRVFIDQPMLAHDVSRERLYTLACEVSASGYAYGSADLLLLAGNSAAFLGRYDDALDAYVQVAEQTLPDDPRELRALAQILAIYQARGEQSEADVAAERLRRAAPPDHPLAVLPIAHTGITLVQRGNPQAAEMPLREAITAIEPRAGDREWSELHTRLNDWLARALVMQGRYDEAIRLLRVALSTANQQRPDRALIAMLNNDLGSAYIRRSQPGDRQHARVSLKRSLQERESLGDTIGRLRTGQNLAYNSVDLARSAEDWREAEAFYQRLLPLAEHVQDFDASQIYGNYLELLIRRGDAAQIDKVVERLKTRPDTGGFARARGEINVAGVWFWREHIDACTRELAALAEDLADDADTDQQVEWATLWLQLHLRYGVAYDTVLIAAIAEHPLAQNERPLDRANQCQLRGLLAAARGDLSVAQEDLEQARRLFEVIGFVYSAALTLLWQAEAVRAVGRPAAALARQAISALAPFGETPALARARELALLGEGA